MSHRKLRAMPTLSLRHHRHHRRYWTYPPAADHLLNLRSCFPHTTSPALQRGKGFSWTILTVTVSQ